MSAPVSRIAKLKTSERSVAVVLSAEHPASVSSLVDHSPLGDGR